MAKYYIYFFRIVMVFFTVLVGYGAFKTRPRYKTIVSSCFTVFVLFIMSFISKSFMMNNFMSGNMIDMNMMGSNFVSFNIFIPTFFINLAFCVALGCIIGLVLSLFKGK